MSHTLYTEDFKREAVQLALSSDLPVYQIAKDLGIGKTTLGTWIRLHRQVQEEPIPLSCNPKDTREELARLRKENKVLREERDILKKATAFFASQK